MILFGKETRERKIEGILLEKYNCYYRLAYSYVHNEADASDIVQEGAYRAILNSGSLKRTEYAQTWVYRIMLNEIFRFMSKNKDAESDTVSFDELGEEFGKEDRYEDIDLARALEAIPPKDKAVVELKYFEDMKLSEIAEVMGENVNTVKSRLYRSLRKLKLELGDVHKSEEMED